MWLRIHVDNLIRPLVKEKDLLYYKLLKDWHLIIGANLRDKVFPHDIKFHKNNDTILTVTINNHCNVLEIQMMIPKIIERISRYLGFDYISKIKIIGLKNKNSKNKDNEDSEGNRKSLFSKNSFSKDKDVISSINSNTNDEIRDILLRIARGLK